MEYKNLKTLFNSGLENKKHEFGCGFYVTGEFLKYVKDFEIINERIRYLRLLLSFMMKRVSVLYQFNDVHTWS